MTKRLAVIAAIAACGGGSSSPPTGTRVGPALGAAMNAAADVRAPWRCAAADGPRLADETLVLGDRKWRLAGDTFALDGPHDRPIAIGIVADAGGAAPATLAALGRLQAQLAEADLVIALGGMGTTQAELEATLGTIAQKSPVIAVPGDLEPVTAQTAAITALRARGRAVIDGRLARRIELPGITIATVPGARAAVRLAAGADGCGYAPADVARLVEALRPRPGLRILATAEAPRHVVDGEAVGELAVTPGAQQEIDLVLHAPIGEAASPARQGNRDGAAIALSPGTADATTRLPGPRRPASAGILLVTGGGWRWRPLVDPS